MVTSYAGFSRLGYLQEPTETSIVLSVLDPSSATYLSWLRRVIYRVGAEVGHLQQLSASYLQVIVVTHRSPLVTHVFHFYEVDFLRGISTHTSNYTGTFFRLHV